MAFRLYALFFVACVAAARSAIVPTGLPMPMSNQIMPEMLPHELVPQMPFHAVPSPGVTLQSGAVHYLAPEEKIVDLDKMGHLLKATGLIAKLKLKGLKLLKKGIKLVGKLAVVGIAALVVAALSVGITAVLCKHTGLCTLKFHKFQFDREHLEAVRSFATSSKFSALTKFVMNALDEYDDKEE